MAEQLRFDIITDLPTAEKIWKELSPAQSLFDDWDFRAGFHKYHQKRLAFCAGYQSNELVGLLPLQFNDEGKYWEFFGGSYMEDNRVFIKQGAESCIEQFYAFAEHELKDLKLEYIAGSDPYTTTLPVQDYKYVLPLTFTDGEQYIEEVFHGETKKKLKKRIAKVAEGGIEILVDQIEDMELLIEYNLEMFTDSAFRDRPFHKEIFRDFLLPNRDFTARLLTFIVNGKKTAVTLALIYKDTYASINRGFSTDADKNLRELVQLRKVEDAVGLQLKKFDGLAGDYGWKERWGMQKIPQYKYAPK